MSLSRITNEPHFEIISYPEFVNDEKFLVIDLEDSIELISELGSKEYLCFGSCYCGIEEERKSVPTVSRSLKYVVGAASTIVAINFAKSYFSDLCVNELSEEIDCLNPLIRSEVDDCEEIREYPTQLPLPFGKEFVDPVDLDEVESQSSAEVGLKNQKIYQDCEDEVTVVYTDGCCNDNGQENAQAGVGVYFGHKDERNIARRLPGKQTNNRAELTAILDGINSVPDRCNVMIRTDSLYSIHVLLGKWKASGNVDLVNHIKKRIKERKGKVSFVKVKGHSGEKDGNYFADLLAMEGANKEL